MFVEFPIFKKTTQDRDPERPFDFNIVDDVNFIDPCYESVTMIRPEEIERIDGWSPYNDGVDRGCIIFTKTGDYIHVFCSVHEAIERIRIVEEKQVREGLNRLLTINN